MVRHCRLLFPIFFFSTVTLVILTPSLAKPMFRRYKLVHEGIQNVRTRPEVFFEATLKKFNHTTPVIDAVFELRDPAANNWKTWVEGFERLGLDHTYTKSAISLSSTFCEFVTGKFIINRGWRDFGNMPSSCPIKKGKYSMQNYVIEDKYLPPFVPGIHWRLDFISGPDGTRQNNETAIMSYYTKVVYY
ncbi:unnamed protein product [Bemisia tabaci]|uniref:Uncharacterized protein n=1 Tax=Bemisia tabaci TaxID=7038 RepID=A0A9P0F2M3_BEMTA|nr:unnamed protein product [Bemisia tabaci]